MKRVSPEAIATAGLLTLVLTACAPRAALRQPNILLVSVDTLRADHLSSYGYERETSPFLDSLAAEGVRFEHAYATSSWTTPSVVSMLTSTYQSQHRMGARLRGVPRTWSRIPEELPNLPEILRQHGYRTFGLATNANLEAARGFDRGFDRYRCLGVADIEEVEQALGPFVEELAADERPWFFWLHLLDPHAPYRGRPPWIDQFAPDHTRYPRLDAMSSERLAREAPRLGARRLDIVRAHYDSEIRDTDEFLRRVFDRLPDARQAFTLLTSDHGEEFLEHGGVLHGRTLYEESIRIPFIVRLPDGRLAGTVVDEAVSLIDVLPTVLGAANIAPPAAAAGADLIGERGVTVPVGRFVVAELLRGDPWRAVTDGHWKFILREENADEADLFELDRDPLERSDVVIREEHAGRVAGFRDFISAFERLHRADAEPLQEVEISPEQLEALKALGYIGSD